MAPKRERLELALKSLREKEKAYNEAVIQLQKLRSELESLEQMYDAKMKEKEDLIRLVSTWKSSTWNIDPFLPPPQARNNDARRRKYSTNSPFQQRANWPRGSITDLVKTFLSNKIQLF